MADYATVSDIMQLKRLLNSEEQVRATRLIPIVCSLIRFEAQKTGRNFDQMIYASNLVTEVDAFEGDGEKVTFRLTSTPVKGVNVTINDEVTKNYTLSGNEITFNVAPVGEVLAFYDYRALADVAKGVVCDVVMRELNTPSYQLPATSYSEGAGSVSQSYTLPNSSGSIKLWPSDLKALGLRRQKIDAINLMNNGRE